MQRIKMDTIFMNSENSKSSGPHVLELKFTNKLDSELVKRLLPYQTLVFITNGKTQKAQTITINLKYMHQHGMINLNNQMDGILCQTFKSISNTF